MIRRSNQAPRRYDRRGYLALEPRAFLEFFMVPESRANEEHGECCVVDICGPLDSHDDGWCDSYEAVLRRCVEACASACKSICLRIDSPGGDVAGCFECARMIRQRCAASGKPLYAYVEKACSAAYAIASAAQWIVMSDTGVCGSIGVISTREDVTAANTARGLRVAFIASGSRKTDGHPDAPLSDAEIKATQQIVDSLASVFFGLVAEHRPISAEQVAALDANSFHGETAIRAGLVDEIGTFDALIARANQGKVIMSAYDKARSALEEAAKGEDANAAAARRALAAMNDDGGDDDDDDGGDDEEKKDDEAAAAGDGASAETSAETEASTTAESGDDAPADDTKKKAVSASAQDPALQALAEVHKLRAQIAADKRAARRRELLASRPDFSPEMIAALRRTDLATVETMVRTLPRGDVPKPKPKPTQAAAADTAVGTRGASQGSTESAPPDPSNELDVRMGLVPTTIGCRREGNALVFGIVPKTSDAAPSGDGGVK